MPSFAALFHAATGQLSSDQPFILVMRPDPQPVHRALMLAPERPIGVVDTDRPIQTSAFEMQRRVRRGAQPKPVFLASKPPNLGRQAPEGLTESSCRRGPHSTQRSCALRSPPGLLPTTAPIDRTWHLPRSGDPTHRHAAREAARPTRRTPRLEAVQSPLRSLLPYSRRTPCFNGATLASRGLSGAAPHNEARMSADFNATNRCAFFASIGPLLMTQTLRMSAGLSMFTAARFLNSHFTISRPYSCPKDRSCAN